MTGVLLLPVLFFVFFQSYKNHILIYIWFVHLFSSHIDKTATPKLKLLDIIFVLEPHTPAKKHPITKHNKCQITSARQKGCISLMCSDRNPRKGKESPETLVMR